MRKKGLVVLLIALVSVCSVFAANMKVGLQMGFGARNYNAIVKASGDDGSGSRATLGLDASIKNKGFYFAGSFAYEVAKNVDILAEVGINTMGKALITTKTSINGVSTTDSGSATDSTPVWFTAFTGAMYKFPVANYLELGVGAGLDVMFGNLGTEGDKDDINAGFGLGLQANASYSITNQVSIVAGGRFGWHFINTNTAIKDAVNELKNTEGTKAASSSQNMISYKFFVGATYSL